MNTEKLTWYAARSGGIIAWLLLAFGLILGLLLSSRVLGRKASPAWLLSIHRFLGGLSVIFTFVHVAAIMLDDFVAFGWTDVLVPWASEWNPGAVAWGIIATYLAIAIELTSFAMRRLPKGLWRGVHWLSAPLFVMATVHGYQAGTDAGRAFIIAIVAACVVLAALTAVRVVNARRQTEPRTDPQVLLEQAKARRARRDAEGDVPVPASAAQTRPVTASWQEEPTAPVLVADHAAVPPPAWTDMQPTEPVAASWAEAATEPEPEAAPPRPDPATRAPAEAVTEHTADRPFWEPSEPSPSTNEPTQEPEAQPFWEPQEPVSEAPSTPASDEPFWTPAEPTVAPTPRPAEPPPRPDREPVARQPEPADFPALEPPPRPDREPVARQPEPADDPVLEPPPVEAPAPMLDRRLVPELEHVGASGDSTAPRPAWTEPDDLAWLTSEPADDPTVSRRPGPVPGVWKRSRREPGIYSDN